MLICDAEALKALVQGEENLKNVTGAGLDPLTVGYGAT